MTRAETIKVEMDTDHGGIHKLNPLTDWTGDDVLGVHPQARRPLQRPARPGFPSIGCEPCTRAVAPGEDERAGRWWWENPETKECGLHVHEKQ